MVVTTGDNKFGVAKWIVDPVLGLGTHTTIAAAITAASSGDDIFIRPGTYTENLTLKAGVNLVGFDGDGTTPNVTIIGNSTLSAAGTVSISNIRLQTNSSFLLSVTGAVASIVNLSQCYLNCTNNTGISFTSSSSSSRINIYNSNMNLATTGIAYYTSSSAGSLVFIDVQSANTGLSTTASSNSAGGVFMFYSGMSAPISTSAGGLAVFYSNIDTSAINSTAVTTSTAGDTTLRFSFIASGTASAISIGASSQVTISNCTIGSSNTNAITGLGTINYGILSFSNTSSNINTTTQNVTNLGPSAMFGSSNSGNNNSLSVVNNSNTASSSSHLASTVAGTSGGDCYSMYAVGSARSWSTGSDNSDSQRFKITTAAAATVNPSSGTTVLTSDGTNIWLTGLSFDAGSNVMANYATGSFTPTAVGGGTAGVTTYGSRQGSYTRIGNRVFFECTIQITAATGTGQLTFGGFPFTINNTANYTPVFNLILNGPALSASNTMAVCNGVINTTTATAAQYNPTTGALSAYNISSGNFFFYLSGNYFI
jgi:hypothetical protein